MKNEQISTQTDAFLRHYNLHNSFIKGLLNPLDLTILPRFEFLERDNQEALSSDWETVWNDFASVVCNQ